LTQKDAPQVVGIIFPLLPQHAKRFLDDGKTIFVKFFGKERIPLRLQPESKMFLYESKGNKEIVGEAKIVRVESVPASNVISAYGDNLFLDESEFADYVGIRRDKTMLVLVLVDAKRYSAPLKLDKSVTMAGRYMTQEMYLKLHEESRKPIKTEA
jgi:hypothetical protein